MTSLSSRIWRGVVAGFCATIVLSICIYIKGAAGIVSEASAIQALVKVSTLWVRSPLTPWVGWADDRTLDPDDGAPSAAPRASDWTSGASPRPSRASSNRALYFFDYDNHAFELDAEDLHDDATVSNTTSHTDSDCPAVSAVRV